MSSGFPIPDRQLTFSPDLAQTIGLEQAILLQGIGYRLAQPGRWHTLHLARLAEEFPFWSEQRIAELLQSLSALGILSLLPTNDPRSLQVATAGTHQPASNAPAPGSTAHTAPEDEWQPSSPVLELLQMNHGIDPSFARAQLADFDVMPADTRESRFRRHVLTAWRRAQARHPVFEIPTPAHFDTDWIPSADALDILHQGGVDEAFIESVRAEFVLYWRERGGPPKDVNSRFIGFVRQRWARYQSGLTHTREPQRLSRDWQPDPSVWDMFDMAGIDRQFAKEKLPEFVLYWSDSNELHTSWNSKFLQHIKYQWRRQQTGSDHEQNPIRGDAGRGGRTRDRSLSDDLNDASWAN